MTTEPETPVLPILFIVDTSIVMSMKSEGKSLGDFVHDVLSCVRDRILADETSAERVEIALVTFGGSVSVSSHFEQASYWKVPESIPNGEPDLFKAVDVGLDLLLGRISRLRHLGIRPFIPWVFVFSSGLSCISTRAEPVIERVHAGDDPHRKPASKLVERFLFYPVRVTANTFDVSEVSGDWGSMRGHLDELDRLAPPHRRPVVLSVGADSREQFVEIFGSHSSDGDGYWNRDEAPITEEEAELLLSPLDTFAAKWKGSGQDSR